MRFESVTAHAFGPFENETLDFAPGINVVFGRNESGKSSWRAALYAGLCGIRRGRGQPRADDRLFRDRHCPWNGDGWEVSVQVTLADGRRVELRHDLEGRVACRATDLGLGRDISSEIINEGTPDGALWLGLDRRSFPATALVRQAEVLAVTERETAAELQQYLQRAVATRGVDATAREALERLAAYRREHVGLPHIHSRPRAHAQRAKAEASGALDSAQEQHEEYLRRVAKAEDLGSRARTMTQHVRTVEAAIKEREARQWAERAQRVRALADHHPTRPPDVTESREQESEVVGLLDAWNNRPRSVTLAGPSSTELEQQISELPGATQDGDLEPHPDVHEALDHYQDAIRSIRLHANQEPQSPEPIDSDVSEADLEGLARDLQIEVPALEPQVKRDLELAQKATEHAGSRLRVALAIGVAGALLGAAIATLGALVPGIVTVSVATGVALALGVHASINQNRAKSHLRELEALVGDRRYEASAAAQRLTDARERAAMLGVAADPTELRRLAEGLRASARLTSEHERWLQQHDELEQAGLQAMQRLGAALSARGVRVGDRGIKVAFDEYKSACEQRAALAQRVTMREHLMRQLEGRRTAEEVAERLDGLETRLRHTSAALGIEGDAPADLFEGLQTWLNRQRTERQELDDARRAWATLETLLEGRSLEELEGDAQRRREEADAAASEVNPDELSRLLAGDMSDLDIDVLRAGADRVAREAEHAQGRVEELAQQIPSVPEAEELLAAAVAELERVERLDETLETTIGFLQSAEEHVNRSISPTLSDAVRQWLPSVTDGHYEDVIVDPESLEVKICGPDRVWHSATFLSQGTAEPVYLLLRIAMAEHLAKDEETCPLILDDVTVQCDHERSQAVMNCLHQISRERQVIAFTQELEVLSWAEASLVEPQDRLVRLELIA